MLVDSGACVARPTLMLARALNYHCPGVQLKPKPPVDNPWVKVNVANGSSMNMMGTLDVLIWFSGASVKANSCKGPPMEWWHPVATAI